MRQLRKYRALRQKPQGTQHHHHRHIALIRLILRGAHFALCAIGEGIRTVVDISLTSLMRMFRSLAVLPTNLTA